MLFWVLWNIRETCSGSFTVQNRADLYFENTPYLKKNNKYIYIFTTGVAADIHAEDLMEVTSYPLPQHLTI
jgi:hypothetical protein